MIKKDILVYGPWDKEELSVIHSNRFIENNTESKQHIQNEWNTYCLKRKSSFDSILLRLNDWKNEKNRIILSTGLTKYSHYIGTRNQEFTKEYPDSFRADPIGMTIIPVTRDRKIIVSKRSRKMEQNPNKLYFIGGYAEPPINEDEAIDFVDEALREAKEEMGVDDFAQLMFIGLAYDSIYCHPELFSVAIVNVTEEELLNSWKTAKDRDESELLRSIPIEDDGRVDFQSFREEETWSYKVGAELFTESVQDKVVQLLNEI